MHWTTNALKTSALAFTLTVGACAPQTADIAQAAELQMSQAVDEQDSYVYAGAQEAGPAEKFDRIIDPAAIDAPDGYTVEVFAQGLTFPTDISWPVAL